MSTNVIDRIREVTVLQKKGEHLFCPCSIPEFNKDFTGLGKGSITCITAGTSQGKTSFLKFLMFDAIKNAIKLKIKIKFLLFLLEENEERFTHSVISYLLFKNYGIRYSTVEFSGRKVDNKGKIQIIDDNVLDKIDEIKEEVSLYMSYMKIYTNVNQPGSIYKIVKGYARDRVQYFDGETPLTIEDIEKEKKYTHVIESDEIIVPVVDHISLISLKDKNLYDAIESLRYYCKFYMEKILHCHVIWVQQNSKANGTVEAIKNELYFASLTNLSDNKSTSNDAYDVISVTLPNMYDVKKWRSYDVDKMKNGLAVVFLAKARYGRVNIKVPFFFDGKCNYYEILPRSKDEAFEDKMEEFYDRVKNFYK